MDFKELLKKYLTDDFIEDLISSLDQKRVNFLILNTNKISDNEFILLFPKVKKHEFIEHGYYYDKNDYDFGKTFYFDNGMFYILDSASALVSHFLDLKDDDYVLDMCAAPGGKTISLSLKNKNIEIISNDISYQRALTLSSNIEKMGIGNVIVTSNQINILEKHYKSTFDKIILDAPCSGSAMFRKSEEMKNDWTYNKVLACHEMQIQLLEQAANMLKPGGIISYSTCSFSYEEDEGTILEFLSNHKDFSTVKLSDNKSFYHCSDLSDAIHIFPNMYDGEGHFICQLRKNGTCQNSRIIENNSKFKHIESINNRIYGYNNDLDLRSLTILRKGVHIKDVIKNKEIPSFHYSHYLDSNNSIQLNELECKKYIHGEELTKKTNLSTGYYIVSFNKLNLGYVHVVGDKLKNLYPKGLRH